MFEFLVTLQQLCIMFLLVLVGFTLFKIKMLNNDTTKDLSNLVVYVAGPCVTLISFQQEFTMDKLIGFLLCFVYSFVILFIGLLIGKLIFGKEKTLEQYACGFSNAGFIGIPLVVGLLGVEYVFYLSAFFVAFNILAWTYGLKLISGKTSITFKKFITNPAIFSVIIGIILFVTQIKIPSILYTTLDYCGNLNTPIGMIVLGTYIANGRIKYIFNNADAYKVTFVRCIVVPIICMLLLSFAYTPIVEIKTVLLIASAAPCGATLAMFAQMYGNDFSYGSRIVSLSTLFSPFTITLVMTLSHLLW